MNTVMLPREIQAKNVETAEISMKTHMMAKAHNRFRSQEFREYHRMS